MNGILGFLAFYRVNYDSELWSAIQKRLENEPEKYGIVQRAQLVADFCYFNSKGLVRNGETLRKKFIQMVYRRLVFSITLDTQEIGPFPTFFLSHRHRKGFLCIDKRDARAFKNYPNAFLSVGLNTDEIFFFILLPGLEKGALIKLKV